MTALAGKVAIVTGAGGAGVGGLGVVFANALAEAGAMVAVSDVDGDAAARVGRELTSRGHRAIGIPADVTNDDDISSMVAAAATEFGGVDILVNNAGLARGKWNEGLALSREDWTTIFGVNTLAPLVCARACRATMASRGGGAIVNLASMAAYGESGAYSVTKLAVVGMTKVLAAELAADNIRVNAIAPGMMTAKLPPEQIEAVVRLQKLPRQGTAQDLVGALLFLCSDQSSFVTGQTILVDGGAVRGHV